MDEATSALDEARQTSLMSLFFNELSSATLLSVGHRPGLEDYHDRKITLTRRPTGARMSSRQIRGKIGTFFKRLRRRA
jgi:putative ATP-binding cassette transporter